MLSQIIALLTTGLNLWDDLEKQKYIDKLISLKKAYYEEFNKVPAERDNAVLDNLDWELRLLASAFITDASKPHPGA